MTEKVNSYYYKGKSMIGTFRTGDRLVLETITIDKLNEGDVIVFKGLDPNESDRDLVHRVISISKKGLTTRGDNNFYVDTVNVSRENLVGRVT